MPASTPGLSLTLEMFRNFQWVSYGSQTKELHPRKTELKLTFGMISLNQGFGASNPENHSAVAVPLSFDRL